MALLKEYVNLLTLLCKGIEHVHVYIHSYFLSKYVHLQDTGTAWILHNDTYTCDTCFSKTGICTSTSLVELVKVISSSKK